MFRYSGLSTFDYNSIFLECSLKVEKSNVTIGSNEINYCNEEDEKLSLINDYGWTINEAGYNCAPEGVNVENKLKFSIYSNPVANLNIGGNNSELKAVVINLLGKEVIQQNITNKIDISHFEKSVYIVILSDGLKVSSQNIAKTDSKLRQYIE